MIPDRKFWGTRMIPGRKKDPAKNTLVVAAMDFTSEKRIISSLKNQDDSYFPIGRRFSILVDE